MTIFEIKGKIFYKDTTDEKANDYPKYLKVIDAARNKDTVFVCYLLDENGCSQQNKEVFTIKEEELWEYYSAIKPEFVIAIRVFRDINKCNEESMRKESDKNSFSIISINKYFTEEDDEEDKKNSTITMIALYGDMNDKYFNEIFGPSDIVRVLYKDHIPGMCAGQYPRLYREIGSKATIKEVYKDIIYGYRYDDFYTMISQIREPDYEIIDNKDDYSLDEYYYEGSSEVVKNLLFGYKDAFENVNQKSFEIYTILLRDKIQYAIYNITNTIPVDVDSSDIEDECNDLFYKLRMMNNKDIETFLGLSMSMCMNARYAFNVKIKDWFEYIKVYENRRMVDDQVKTKINKYFEYLDSRDLLPNGRAVQNILYPLIRGLLEEDINAITNASIKRITNKFLTIDWNSVYIKRSNFEINIRKLMSNNNEYNIILLITNDNQIFLLFYKEKDIEVKAQENITSLDKDELNKFARKAGITYN